MSNGLTVLVGVSGGVDSTVCLMLLKEQGYNVIGVSMSIYNKDIPNLPAAGNSCYGGKEKQDLIEAKKLCDSLGIEHYTFDCSEAFKKTILSYFREEYLNGRTPNPCIKCNTLMKFGLLPELAKQKGIQADYFATGHYARLEKDEKTGLVLLKKGKDEKKDQSYFLYRLTKEQLAHCLFPLGSYTKEEVRKLAKGYGLAVSEKKDSQDFYAGKYTDLLEQAPQKGYIQHINGQVLGIHQGFWNYTIGQRKGLGIASKEPLFVIDLDIEHNRVVVGEAKYCRKKEAIAEDVVWTGLLKAPSTSLEVETKHRSSQRPQKATVTSLSDGKVQIKFQEEQSAIALGQSIVFYQGDTVLGGGILCA